MDAEPLHYDAQARVIYDENRLAVARDVAPDLAAAFCAAPYYVAAAAAHHAYEMTPTDRGGLQGPKSQAKLAWMRLIDMALIIKAENEQPHTPPAAPTLWAILADMLAYQAEQFDADSTFDVIRWEGEHKSQRIMCGLSRTERDEHERTVEPEPNISYQYEEFLPDLQVSGADLVDAFTEWRGQLRAALAATRSPRPAALDRIAARLRGEWYNPAGDLESDIADVLREVGAYD